MSKKLINDANDKAGAIVVGTGVVALARLIGGDGPILDDETFLNDCEKLAERFVDRLIKAESIE